MRIAIVNQPLDGILPPDQNSIGIWSYEVARRLAADHEITVFGRHFRQMKLQGLPRTLSDGGVTYRFGFAAPDRVWSRLGALWERTMAWRMPLYESMLYYLEYCLLVAWRVRRLRPDVVHVHNFTGFVPIIRAFNPNAKIVLHMNCEWLSQLDEQRMGRRIAAADAVFGSSGHIARLVQRRYPQYADRCHTVYNGVDPDAFVGAPKEPAGREPDASPVLVFVGRVSPEKGVHDLIDAMAIVAERHPRARLDLVGPVGALDRRFLVDVSGDARVAGLARFYGDEDYGSMLQRLVRERGLDVHFHGAMSQEHVVQHVAAADVLVNPSYSESFGMALVEAMACGTPVVATRVGGMLEIVDERTGLLTDPSDPVALADAISRLLHDDDLRRSMGAEGRSRVEALFAWDRVAEAALEQYVALAADGGVG